MSIRIVLILALAFLPACVATPGDTTGTSAATSRPCRTELDCADGEVCSVMGDGLACRTPAAGEALVAPGPGGQPPPPVGLLEGNSRLNRTGETP